MDDLETQVMTALRKAGGKGLKESQIAARIKVSKRQLPVLRQLVEHLVESGRVHEGKRGMLRLPTLPGTVVGTIKKISSGAAFLIPHDQPSGEKGGDIFIDAADLRDAQTGDEVLVTLLGRRRSGGQRCGRVEQIITRATNSFVGRYFEQAGQGYVQIDGRNFPDPILVGDPGAKGAQTDDKVVVEMLRFPATYQQGEAVLTQVLGPRGDPGVDTLSIIHEFGLPHEFSEVALEQAREAVDQFDETDREGRLDLTGETIITIDPVDARDFDDAISLSRDESGRWRLGVHIADVSHFVLPGSELDAEVRLRGTSVYLPGTVIPMMPEVISNGLASLQQGKLRYTKSVFIDFTPDGMFEHAEFANSAIRTVRRFAYEEVMPILEAPQKHRKSVGGEVLELLQRMHQLAMILRRRRFAAGALNLELPEVKLRFDKEGKVSGAVQVEHDESHQIIEEFMLAANIAVATALDDRGLSFLRRVHASPDQMKLKGFGQFAAALGYPIRNPQSRHELQELINRVRGKPEERAINYALLRSMKQAEYTGLELGHYALATDDYCHFTSPIRRYPDLTIHRLMDSLLVGKKGGKTSSELDLIKIGKHCSSTERRAAAAERELIKVKLITFLSERIGIEMEALVTGVEHFGLFCQGVEIPAEGMIHISALVPGEYFDFDERSFSLVGRRSGLSFRLGDRIRVEVASVDIDRRMVEFRLAEQNRAKRRPANSSSSESGGSRGNGAMSKREPTAEEVLRDHWGGPRRKTKKSTKSTGPKRYGPPKKGRRKKK